MPKYRAFISYSHRDRRFAERLHRRLEMVRLPNAKEAGGQAGWLRPIFIDRDELRAGSDLNGELEAALRESGWLIVICSPDSAKSRYVQQEILAFKARHGASCIAPIIARGDPTPGAEDACIPPALRFEAEPDGALGTRPCADILAADARPVADGFDNAVLKVAAAVIGTSFDQFRNRHLQRQNRILTAAIALASVIAVALAAGFGLAVHNANVAGHRLDSAVAYARQSSEQVLDLQQGLGLRSGAAKQMLSAAESRLTQMLRETASDNISALFDPQASVRIILALSQTLLNYCEIELEEAALNIEPDKTSRPLLWKRLSLVEQALQRIPTESPLWNEARARVMRLKFIAAAATLDLPEHNADALRKFEEAARLITPQDTARDLVPSQIQLGWGRALWWTVADRLDHLSQNELIPEDINAVLEQVRTHYQTALAGFEAITAHRGMSARIEREIFATRFHLVEVANATDTVAADQYLEETLQTLNALPADISGSVGLLYEKVRLTSMSADALNAQGRLREARLLYRDAIATISRLIALDPDKHLNLCDRSAIQQYLAGVTERIRAPGWRAERKKLLQEAADGRATAGICSN